MEHLRYAVTDADTGHVVARGFNLAAVLERALADYYMPADFAAEDWEGVAAQVDAADGGLAECTDDAFRMTYSPVDI